MIELHDKLRSYGVPEAEIQALPRWCVTGCAAQCTGGMDC